MNDLIFIAMLCTSGLINLSSFDDALIDLLAFGIARASLEDAIAYAAERKTAFSLMPAAIMGCYEDCIQFVGHTKRRESGENGKVDD